MTIKELKNAVYRMVSLSEEHAVEEEFRQLDIAGAEILACLDELEGLRSTNGNT